MFDRDITYRTLERVTNDVLRDFSSLPVQPADGLIPLPGEACVCGRARFGGSKRGVISVAAPVGLCHDMAPVLLHGGGPGADDMLCATRAIAELATIIAGHVLASLPTECVTTLSRPVTERASYHDWVVMSCAGGTVRLWVAGRPLLTSMLLLPS